MGAFASINQISTNGVVVNLAEADKARLASLAGNASFLDLGCGARGVSVVGDAAVKARITGISVGFLCEVEVSSADGSVLVSAGCQVP